MLRRLLLLILLTLLPLTAQAKRVALLVGNGTYELEGMSLVNPVNDVAALGDALEDQDFIVRTVRDASQSSMYRALEWLSINAEDAEMAIFFYAGHGVQVDGDNYMIGANLPELETEAIGQSSLRMSDVRRVMADAGPKIGMIILDACRNNPLSSSGMASPGLATERGGAGLLVAYATDPGNVAYDGTGENSIFTTALLNNLATPGLDVRIMFGRVRQDVIRRTRGAQIPWVEEAVLGEHYIAGQPTGSIALSDDDITAWRNAASAGDVDELTTYISDHPDGLFVAFARERIEQIKAAQVVALSGMPTSEIIAASNTETMMVALDVLGFTQLTRGLKPVAEEVEAAFDEWRSTQPNPTGATPEALYRDAARLSMFLAANTAQQIRTDLKAIEIVEKHLDLASTDLASLRRLAETNKAAADILETAEADVAAVVAARDKISARLDKSVSYYHSMVDRAKEYFAPQTTIDLLTRRNDTRAPAVFQERLYADAETFVNQVKAAQTRAPGSYAWLTTFLPEA